MSYARLCIRVMPAKLLRNTTIILGTVKVRLIVTMRQWHAKGKSGEDSPRIRCEGPSTNFKFLNKCTYMQEYKKGDFLFREDDYV